MRVSSSALPWTRLGWIAVACVGLLPAWACSDQPLEPVRPGSCAQAWGPSYAIDMVVNVDIDILFVIDNSRSMAEEQATLAASFPLFIKILERPENAYNYRIGVTTTDNGNPLCSGTTPEEGALQLRSCRSRPEDFVVGGDAPLDVTDEACNALCPEEWTNIETLPTPTWTDYQTRPRPWIERTVGVSNLPEGLSTAQALTCIGPQGISGCTFESPLESMWRAVERSQTPGDPSFGFIRDHALLMIVHVGDEADCSYNPAWTSIFSPEGNRVFWSDQEASAPTSAVCWNAGVTCSGASPGPYACRSGDLDVDGHEVDPGQAEALAVLHPMSRYIDQLQELEDRKQLIVEHQQLVVSILGGVGSDGSVLYRDSVNDPDFQADFGIGPGCRSTFGRASPPVRLRELAEAFEVNRARNLFSICDHDHTPAFDIIAERLADQRRPPYLPACVADTDPSTPDVLDPSCVLVQDVPEGIGPFADVEIPPCQAEWVVPEGHDVCYRTLVGDERSAYTIEAGFNLEFGIVRRQGVYVPPGTVVRARCALSQCPTIDCPDLL